MAKLLIVVVFSFSILFYEFIIIIVEGRSFGGFMINPYLIGESSDFYIYYVVNQEESSFPEKLDGSIGVTFDNKVNGMVHRIVNLSAQISQSVNKPNSDERLWINPTLAVHAFVVLGQGANGHIMRVGEAAGPGIVRANISICDADWTAMVIFKPKSQDFCDMIVKNMELELQPDANSKTAQYPAVKGFLSSFHQQDEEIDSKNLVRLAYAMSDFIRGSSIRDIEGAPKDAICSAVALRVLQASVIMSKITEKEFEKYREIPRDDLAKLLLIKLNSDQHPLNKELQRSNLFKLSSSKTLPYQIYESLINEMPSSSIYPKAWAMYALHQLDPALFLALKQSPEKAYQSVLKKLLTRLEDYHKQRSELSVTNLISMPFSNRELTEGKIEKVSSPLREQVKIILAGPASIDSLEASLEVLRKFKNEEKSLRAAHKESRGELSQIIVASIAELEILKTYLSNF